MNLTCGRNIALCCRAIDILTNSSTDINKDIEGVLDTTFLMWIYKDFKEGA